MKSRHGGRRRREGCSSQSGENTRSSSSASAGEPRGQACHARREHTVCPRRGPRARPARSVPARRPWMCTPSAAAIWRSSRVLVRRSPKPRSPVSAYRSWLSTCAVAEEISSPSVQNAARDISSGPARRTDSIRCGITALTPPRRGSRFELTVSQRGATGVAKLGSSTPIGKEVFMREGFLNRERDALDHY